jgi:hypothetical protein
MTCRCRSGECDPECDGPKLRAEIERLNQDREKYFLDNLDLRAEVERLRAAGQRALDHYDMRSELYTSDADVATGMASILREPKP